MSASYIKHGFLGNVYSLWAGIEGSEWGYDMTNLCTAYEGSYIWNEEQLDVMEGILRYHFEAAEDFLLGDYAEYALRAQREYKDVADDWRERAESFDEVAAFEEAEANLFPWMKSPDPEFLRETVIQTLNEKRRDLERQMESLKKELEKLGVVE